MNDLTLFGTVAFPIHPSAMRGIVECPWRVVMRFLDMEPEEGDKPAADTGSAMHKAAAALHTGNTVAESIAIMGGGLSAYPAADLVDAANMFLQYSQDTRNTRAKVILVEEPIAFQIQAHETDPTGEPIVVNGRCDQVRLNDYGFKAWDIKTSKRDPNELLAESWFQMAGYCVGTTMRLRERGYPDAIVQPGGLICPRKYGGNVESSNVFWHHNFKFEDIEQLFLPLRQRVAQIRAGHLYHFPNSDCRWCHQRTPDVCFPKLNAYKRSLL